LALRAVIIANGSLEGKIDIFPSDLLIAADGGARHCLEAGLHPAFVVGDLDSLEDDQIKQLESWGTSFVRYPVRKDQTDLELALELAIEKGADEIMLLGALGVRWDQTIANILLVSTRPSPRVHIVDGPQELFFLHNGGSIELSGQPGDVVSLIPLVGNALGITTADLEYPLKGEDLVFGSTRGVSNVLTAARAQVHLSEGLLLCTIYHL
jgi:thiamine pyrophosphokinase